MARGRSRIASIAITAALIATASTATLTVVPARAGDCKDAATHGWRASKPTLAYSKLFSVWSQAADNRTPGPAVFNGTTGMTGTAGVSFSGTVEGSVGTSLLAQVKASATVAVQASVGVSASTSLSVNVPAYKTYYMYWGVQRQYWKFDYYYVTMTCAITNKTTRYIEVPYTQTPKWVVSTAPVAHDGMP